MKRYFTLFVLLLASLIATAQDLKITKIELNPRMQTALVNQEVDPVGQRKCAVLHVVTEGLTPEERNYKLHFQLDNAHSIVKTVQDGGEIQLYVPDGTVKLTVKSEMGNYRCDFRDHGFKDGVESLKDYYVYIVYNRPAAQTESTPAITQQYLVFQVTPPDAALEVNDQIWPVSAEGTARKFVNFGTYDYRVQAPNYHPEVGKVTVNDPNNKKIMKVDLKPNFGWIEVSGTGLQGASVYVDNALIGKAPCKSEALKSGQHSVKIAKELYETFTQTVTVTDNETTRISPSLTADFANVTLAVDADAEIWVNDELKGTRRWTGNLAIGTYKIECKMTSHETTLTTKEITNNMNGQTISLNAPRPIYGSLNIESSPDFCDIYIDGKKVGETPMFVSELLIGRHEVKISKTNYADYTETVTIAKGETKTVNATLMKYDGPLTFTVNGVSFKMLPVEGGTFTMGATAEQGSDAYDNEKPTHSVTLSSFYMGETEVTQALWQAVMGSNPSNFKGNNLPVETVSWNDCQTFITKLNQQCAGQLNGRQFRLPTEAEWEYAARGGKKSHGYKYSGSNDLGNVAWYYDNSSSTTHAVGTKTPNELGLYDMSGNVWEWCSDWFGSYGSGAQTNPTGSTSGSDRVNRGGSWSNRAGYCRVSLRGNSRPGSTGSYLGLRLAL